MSTFDVVLSGVHPVVVTHSLELLGEVVRVLRPGGTLVLHEAVSNTGPVRTTEQLLSLLKISGLSQPTRLEPVALSAGELQQVGERLGVQDAHARLVEIHCRKPDYEVGSSQKLSFASAAKQPANMAAVWKLDDIVDDDIETIDPDELLDEEDLKKPDPSSLRAIAIANASDCFPVCSSTGKRKACKNCSCGLAEELATNNKPVQKTATSSCGSCYLGDAFRCASCPYLGMPAFKPGEKIQLTDRQLKADV
ncbi:hypothetical protein PR048_000082 [Dryococelus australis]|uniref:Anamorsin homolog n=1 Tax=Dryococelus australis TaxID=614101 RepID=A0ABQ9IEW5_9NEOP|nr:hypothetical protein PR048_000082 [Dryococelus australis]